MNRCETKCTRTFDVCFMAWKTISDTIRRFLSGHCTRVYITRIRERFFQVCYYFSPPARTSEKKNYYYYYFTQEIKNYPRHVYTAYLMDADWSIGRGKRRYHSSGRNTLTLNCSYGYVTSRRVRENCSWTTRSITYTRGRTRHWYWQVGTGFK